MEHRSVDIARGFNWYVEGWHYFKPNPGMLIGLIIAYLVIALVLSIVPLIGGLVLALIGPALIAGYLLAVRHSADGEKVAFGDLFAPLADPAKRTPLLVLGGVAIGLTLLMAIVTAVFMGGSMAAMSPGHAGMNTGAAGVGMLLGFLVMMVFALALAMAMFYAVPLVYFADARPVEAVKASLAACIANILPLLVFGLVGFGLALVAAIPFGLGFLILLPVMLAAEYASFRDVFPQEPPAFEVPPASD